MKHVAKILMVAVMLFMMFGFSGKAEAWNYCYPKACVHPPTHIIDFSKKVKIKPIYPPIHRPITPPVYR